MSQSEFKGWMLYFEVRPYGWEEDLRTYRIMQGAGNLAKNTKPNDFFPTLKAIMKQSVQYEGLEEGQIPAAHFDRSPFAQLLREHWRRNDSTNQEPGQGVPTPDPSSQV